MKIRWTMPAAADLQHIKNYLDEHQSHLSVSTIRKLYSAVRSLSRMPERGRAGVKLGTCELIILPLPYLVVYRIRGDAVEVLRIHHASQQRS